MFDEKNFYFVYIFNLTYANAQGVAVQGHLDCATWLEARKSNNAARFEHYVLGFVNGLALGRMVDIWNAKAVKVTNSQLYYWMDNYCNKNPLNDVVLGSVEFADEMTSGAYKKAIRK